MVSSLTLDTGPLIACERGDRATWSVVKAAAEAGLRPIVPAGVLAQAWRHPRQARLSSLLKLCEVAPLSASAARRAGELLARAGTDDVIDASVVVAAIGAGPSVIFTTDPGDIGALIDVLPAGAGRPTVRAF